MNSKVINSIKIASSPNKPLKQARPDPPKNPFSGFAFFYRDTLGEVKRERPESKPAEINFIVGEKWKELDKESKQEYEKLYQEAKKKYEKEAKDYEDKYGKIERKKRRNSHKIENL